MFESQDGVGPIIMPNVPKPWLCPPKASKSKTVIFMDEIKYPQLVSWPPQVISKIQLGLSEHSMPQNPKVYHYFPHDNGFVILVYPHCQTHNTHIQDCWPYIPRITCS